jgi:hypothetical protein
MKFLHPPCKSEHQEGSGETCSNTNTSSAIGIDGADGINGIEGADGINGIEGADNTSNANARQGADGGKWTDAGLLY